MKSVRPESHKPNPYLTFGLQTTLSTAVNWVGKKLFVEKLGDEVSNKQVFAMAFAGTATHTIADKLATMGLGKRYTKNGYVKVIVQALSFFAVAYAITSQKLGRFAVQITPKQAMAFMGLTAGTLYVLSHFNKNGSPSSAQRRSPYSSHDPRTQRRDHRHEPSSWSGSINASQARTHSGFSGMVSFVEDGKPMMQKFDSQEAYDAYMLRVMSEAGLSETMMARTTFTQAHVAEMSEENLRALNGALISDRTGRPETPAPLMRSSTASMSPSLIAPAQPWFDSTEAHQAFVKAHEAL